MLSIFNRGTDAHKIASKIFSDGIMTLVMSAIMANNNISDEELERKVREKLKADNVSEIVKDNVKMLEALGIIERKEGKLVLTPFGEKVGKVLKDMLETYYETFTSLS
ncbi:MAG: hypothetical protein RXQ99_09170 [Acidianus sp.]|uniref:hypothetical protein n=1 Tax=Acidianus sp. TaxID=1872104 RepID=UPI00397C79A1